MLLRVHFAWAGFELTMLVVIGTDCIGSYKYNYHAITTTSDRVDNEKYGNIVFDAIFVQFFR